MKEPFVTITKSEYERLIHIEENTMKESIQIFRHTTMFSTDQKYTKIIAHINLDEQGKKEATEYLKNLSDDAYCDLLEKREYEVMISNLKKMHQSELEKIPKWIRKIYIKP